MTKIVKGSAATAIKRFSLSPSNLLAVLTHSIFNAPKFGIRLLVLSTKIRIDHQFLFQVRYLGHDATSLITH